MTGFAELAERMAPACAESVDDMEVAAVLEADGITDAIAARRYGSPDVFHLAERLCQHTPRWPGPVVVTDGPWEANPRRHLLRGALFGIPALCYLAASGTATGARAGSVIVMSVLLSWAISQAMAYLGLVRRGWGDPEGAARVLRAGLLWAGLPALLVTLAVAALLAVPVAVVLVAVGQVLYLLSATVALVVGLEHLLLVALAPGALAAVVGLALGGDAVRSAPVATGAAVTVVAALGVALHGTRAAVPQRPTGAELRDAVPQALFGLCAGGLLLFVPVVRTMAPTVTAGGAGAAAGALAGGTAVGLATMLPLTVSMGLAEWLLYRYRAATHRALQRSTTLSGFARQAGTALLRTGTGYLAALAAASAAAGVLVWWLTGRALEPLTLAGFAALGGALFFALLLMSFRLRAPVVIGCAAALAVEYGLIVRGALVGRPVDPDLVQLFISAALLLVLLAYSLTALSRATRHH